MRSSNTPLILMRRAARGSLTQADVVAFMKDNGLKRDQVTISDFERAKYLGPDEFVALYAQAIGQSVAAVRRAWEETRTARSRKAKARPKKAKAARRPRR